MRKRISLKYCDKTLLYELLDSNNHDYKESKKPSKYKKIGVAVAGIFFLAIIGIIIGLVIGPYIGTHELWDEAEEKCKASHESYDLDISLSELRKYKEFAVASDIEQCSKVGADVLKENGSVVDAAIATGLCNGIAHCQSSGIGGGHFMVIFLKDKNQTYAIDAREAASLNAEKYMFRNKSSIRGGLATAIPGEVYGFWEAYKLGGRLPWKRLFEPVIKMCRDGFRISKTLAKVIRNNEETIRNEPSLSEIFLKQTNNQIFKENDTIQMVKLSKTLEIISETNIESFYHGDLAKLMVDEINENGGNVTLQDFKIYKALIKKPIVVDISNKFRLLTQPPPASGILVSLIMRVMNQFDMNNQTLSNSKSNALFHHRLLEVFKHSYNQRSLLGDNNIEDMSLVEANLLDDSFVNKIRSKINDEKTFPSSYYGAEAGKETPGTTHISVLANDGAVSLSSTINTYFGAKYIGKNTGVIFNNEMDDFSSPGVINYFGLRPSESNFIKPQKRPMSSMSPSIIFEKETNSVRLVLGASGGSRIITAVAQVAIENLWINEDIKYCIDKKRIHHQLYPEYAEVEIGSDRDFRNSLKEFGHTLKCAQASSIIQGITKLSDGQIEANCDGRKGGKPDGV